MNRGIIISARPLARVETLVASVRPAEPIVLRPASGERIPASGVMRVQVDNGGDSSIRFDIDVFSQPPRQDRFAGNGDVYSADASSSVVRDVPLPTDGRTYTVRVSQSLSGGAFFASGGSPDEIIVQGRYVDIEIVTTKVAAATPDGTAIWPLTQRSAPAPRVTQSDQTFADYAALMSLLNSKRDHGGAVYHWAAGQTIAIPSSIRIVQASNFTISSDPANPAHIKGSATSRHTSGATYWGLYFDRCEDVTLENFEISHVRNWVIEIGEGVPTSQSPNAGRDNRNFTLRNLDIHHGWADAVSFTHGSRGLLQEDCKVHDIGFRGVDPATGQDRGAASDEGNYCGSGNYPDLYVEDVVIRGCEYWNVGEAIEVKVKSRNVLIEHNYVHDVSVASQGAITLLVDGARDFDGDIVVRRNIVHGVRTRQSDGNAITAAGGSIEVYENVLWDVPKHVIDLYDLYTGPNRNVTVRDNVLWNGTGFRPVRITDNYGGSGKNPHGDPNLTQSGNYVRSDGAPGDIVVPESYWRGPLTGTADAGQGPGSGFVAAG